MFGAASIACSAQRPPSPAAALRLQQAECARSMLSGWSSPCSVRFGPTGLTSRWQLLLHCALVCTHWPVSALRHAQRAMRLLPNHSCRTQLLRAAHDMFAGDRACPAGRPDGSSSDTAKMPEWQLLKKQAFAKQLTAGGAASAGSAPAGAAAMKGCAAGLPPFTAGGPCLPWRWLLSGWAAALPATRRSVR